MAIVLPPLPYAKDALSPHISEETINFHYGKHHQTYVDNLNGLIAGTDLAEKSLEEIIKTSDGGIFNNAAQIWNHTFYWESMKPDGGGEVPEVLAKKLAENFGSVENFRSEFTQAALTQFGSGWAWLVKKLDGSLGIQKTANAETPLTDNNITPLLTVDVWEHAYYLDFQNRRPDYVNTFLNHLVNWDQVVARMG
jgi:Fe-Mn family superoxide dismutase